MSNAPNPPARRSVFMSYSHQNQEVARRVHAALMARGITVWIDQKNLQPNSSDWEEEMREAIRQSQALVLLASPESRQSLYVKGELSLAEARSCPIYLLWVSGDDWVNSIRADWVGRHYYDARIPNEQKGIDELLDALNNILPRQSSGETLTALANLKGHTAEVLAVAWSPNGAYLASAGSDETIRIWNVSSGKLEYVFKGHQRSIHALAWSGNGKYLASAGEDKTVRVWDVSASAIVDKAARVWGAEKEFPLDHDAMVFAVAWSPDSTQLASAGDDKTVRVWDIATKTVVHEFPHEYGAVRSVAWSPVALYLASGGDDHQVRIWEVASNRQVKNFEHGSVVHSVVWSPTGESLASACYDRTVSVLHFTTSSQPNNAANPGAPRPSASFFPEGLPFGSSHNVVARHGDVVLTVAWSHRGRLASGSKDCKVQVWKAANTGLSNSYNHSGVVHNLAWSPDGSHLASASGDRTVQVWKVKPEGLDDLRRKRWWIAFMGLSLTRKAFIVLLAMVVVAALSLGGVWIFQLLVSLFTPPPQPPPKRGWSNRLSLEQASASGPAMAVSSDGLLNLAFVANNDTGELLLVSSSDGTDWLSTNQRLEEASAMGLALAALNSTLYAAFVAKNGSHKLLLSSSADWSSNSVVMGNTTTALIPLTALQAPALVAWGDTLYLAFVYPGESLIESPAGSLILVSSSDQGQTWNSIASLGSTSQAPALAVLNGTFYLAYVDNPTGKLMLLISQDYGQHWIPGPDVMQTSTQAPALAAWDDTLYLAYVDDVHELHVKSTQARGDMTWTTLPAVGQYTSTAPALAVMNGTLYLVFVADEEDHLYLVYLNVAAGSAA